MLTYKIGEIKKKEEGRLLDLSFSILTKLPFNSFFSLLLPLLYIPLFAIVILITTFYYLVFYLLYLATLYSSTFLT